MHRKKTGDKNGSTLVIVVCISALLMAFALAMLYTAGLLLARANRRLEQDRSYQLAQSFAKVYLLVFTVMSIISLKEDTGNMTPIIRTKPFSIIRLLCQRGWIRKNTAQSRWSCIKKLIRTRMWICPVSW